VGIAKFLRWIIVGMVVVCVLLAAMVFFFRGGQEPEDQSGLEKDRAGEAAAIIGQYRLEG
jgi:flagellar basal body-associated protein FliL